MHRRHPKDIGECCQRRLLANMGEEAQSLEKEAQSRLTGKGDASKGLGQAWSLDTNSALRHDLG